MTEVHTIMWRLSEFPLYLTIWPFCVAVFEQLPKLNHFHDCAHLKHGQSYLCQCQGRLRLGSSSPPCEGRCNTFSSHPSSWASSWIPAGRAGCYPGPSCHQPTQLWWGGGHFGVKNSDKKGLRQCAKLQDLCGGDCCCDYCCSGGKTKYNPTL